MVRSLKSPSFWVALVALVVAMGGSAVAATLINGKNIRKATISGNRLKKNTLTGTQIAESKLKVPKATHSFTADKATTAGAASDTGLLGGQPPARYQRYGQGLSAGYTETGAAGCTATASECVVSFEGAASVDVNTIRHGGEPGCSGNVDAPTAAAGVLCLYGAPGKALNGRPITGGSRFGFVVVGPGEGTYAYTSPTPPVPD